MLTIKAYSIFDDFGEEPAAVIRSAGIELMVHPLGVPRPDSSQMKTILSEYDIVIIGTSQKITEDMFDTITTPRIIATASVGVDHIRIPEEKKSLVKIINTPKANAQSVAEYTIACMLSCCKRLAEGDRVYREGKNNKALLRKPEDLAGKTIGVVGAGNIAVRIMEFAQFFGMNILCWTRDPSHHADLTAKGVRFVSLEELAAASDYISVNLPNNAGTKNIISAGLVEKMKPEAVFVTISRLDTVDMQALLKKATENRTFYLCADIDPDPEVAALAAADHAPNILITPHIAGGTVETRKRMFLEVAEALANGRQ